MANSDEQELRYQCAYCDQSFRQDSSCYRHMKGHYQQEDSLECDRCGRKFNRRDNLIRHQRTGGKCDKTFRNLQANPESHSPEQTTGQLTPESAADPAVESVARSGSVSTPTPALRTTARTITSASLSDGSSRPHTINTAKDLPQLAEADEPSSATPLLREPTTQRPKASTRTLDGPNSIPTPPKSFFNDSLRRDKVWPGAVVANDESDPDERAQSLAAVNRAAQATESAKLSNRSPRPAPSQLQQYDALQEPQQGLSERVPMLRALGSQASSSQNQYPSSYIRQKGPTTPAKPYARPPTIPSTRTSRPIHSGVDPNFETNSTPEIPRWIASRQADSVDAEVFSEIDKLKHQVTALTSSVDQLRTVVRTFDVRMGAMESRMAACEQRLSAVPLKF